MKKFINLDVVEVCSYIHQPAKTGNPNAIKIVENPVLCKVECLTSYKHYEEVIFVQGEAYLIWITQCYRPQEKKRSFSHFVALPQEKVPGKPVFFVVPAETFGEYQKVNLENCVFDSEPYLVIRDFFGNAMMRPEWNFDRRKMQAFIAQELGGEFSDYAVFPRIIWPSYNMQECFLAWEAVNISYRKNVVAYFNLFAQEFVKNPENMIYVDAIRANGKIITRPFNQIGFRKNKLIIKIA